MNKIFFVLFFLWACSSGKPISNLTQEKVFKENIKKQESINLKEYSFLNNRQIKIKKNEQMDSDEEEFENDFQMALSSFKTENEELFFNLGKKASIPDKFIFPLKMRSSVTSQFGMRFHPTKRKNLFHKGVDIKASHKTNVLASASGRVILSKQTKAFGNVVIIVHPRGISTVYAHNHLNIVRIGDSVKKGQIIALSGNSGDSTGPHLHFEVRHKDKAIDPISFLQNQGKNLK